MTNIKMVPLSTLVKRVKVGYVGTVDKFYCSANEGVMILRPTDIIENGFDFSQVRYITKEFHLKNRKSQLHYGDVILSRCGKDGVPVIYKNTAEAQMLNAVIIEPDLSKMSAEAICLLLKTPFIQKQIANLTSGSVQGVINTTSIAAIKVPIIDNINYEEIAESINVLDGKIANNNAICADLEGMAKLLYDYWFVQFDFPDENGKPYKSSGGKMVWNEELKREIPEGWTSIRLNDIIALSQNRITQKEIGDRVYVPIEVIPRKRMSFYETAHVDKAATGLCNFSEKAILLSNRRVYFHKVCISPFNGVTRDTVIIINPTERENLGFVYQIVNSDHFIEYATRNSYGTEQPVLSPLTVLEYPILKTNNSLEMEYSNRVSKCIDQVLFLQKENRDLVSLRDFLLPMLMNGQVKVKETIA